MNSEGWSQPTVIDETRRRLLDASVELLIGRDGLGALTQSGAEKAAGIAPGYVTETFSDETDWLLAIMERLFEIRTEQYVTALEPIPLEQRNLAQMIDALWGFFAGPTWVAWLELFLHLRGNPDTRESVIQMTTAFDRQIGPMLSDFLSAEEPASKSRIALAMMTLDGMALASVVTTGMFDYGAILAALKQVIGVQSQPQ